MLEAGLKRDVLQFVAGHPSLKLFNNPVGSGYCGRPVSHKAGRVVLEFARRVTYGLFGAGGSDLVGWKTITITPEDVGKKIAVFTAIELKRPDGRGRTTADQLDVLELVNKSGGIGLVVTSVQQLIGEFGG